MRKIYRLLTTRMCEDGSELLTVVGTFSVKMEAIKEARERVKTIPGQRYIVTVDLGEAFMRDKDVWTYAAGMENKI